MSEHLPARTAFVTGAARGIGAAVAVALARRGIAPVLAVRNPDAARGVADAVLATGQSCLVLPCDVADVASVQAAIAKMLAAWGRLDVVVNNAGVIEPIGHLHDTDPATWAQAVTTNLVGCYHVLHAALPALMKSKGTIVNISTGAAHNPREGWSAYCSSKAGLAMLTRCAALEYGPRGILAYGLAPGLVDTEMQVRIRGSGMNEISQVPRENLAPPERSAGVVAWLADQRPSDLQGQDLTVNDAALLQRTGVTH
ncbi:SDR family oxidoreductase [Ramlibacter sp. G-1-2-2]|uniref:SDR family oxidoreductase n=1 Tax=Ramlibacter agri TaxID=2728837 RepID=A0A848H431_9BURK|nr:SDR family oxidoreductase [Ramlibacter agri]